MIDQIWQKVLEGASHAEMLLIGVLVWLWLSHRDLVNDLRDEVKRRRQVERAKEGDK